MTIFQPVSLSHFSINSNSKKKILLTKEGTAKLADFGTAALLSAKSETAMGTPFWSLFSLYFPFFLINTENLFHLVAPEMIEGQGAVTASDIWSLGCLVIELLQGEPPYFHLPGVTACFRMVEDERPPYPEDISEEVKDFLDKCFLKDVNKRATALQLLKHSWILKHKVIS